MSSPESLLEMRRMLAQHRPADPQALSRVGGIIQSERPAFPLAQDAILAADSLPTDLDARMARAALDAAVEAVAPSVGVIEIIDGQQQVKVATGFRVSPDPRRIVTAAHVASALLKLNASAATGKILDERDLRPALIVFEASFQHGREICDIEAIEWIHRRWDLMICRLKTDSGRPEVPLATAPNSDKAICVIGYPLSLSGENLNNFSQTIEPQNVGKKCASPGLLTSRADEGRIGYDCTTLPGNSGSPVVLVKTADVIGLHYMGGTQNGENLSVDISRALEEAPLRTALLDATPLQNGHLIPDPWPDGLSRRVGKDVAGFRQSREEAADAPLVEAQAVLEDREDARDADYRFVPHAPFLPDRLTPDYSEPIETQIDPWSCTGFALAAAINRQLVQRAKGGTIPVKRVSPAMLYAAAVGSDEYADDLAGGTSLRGAIKGFFRFGVCTAETLPYRGHDPDWQLTREISREAREIALGGYSRVDLRIFDFQAAILETGALAVSARLHEGWRRGGNAITTIPFPGKPTGGAHAFVLVGYDDEGFIIQNSWGKDWSRWDRQPGYARWSYEDWEENVIDAWVLRLAPRAPRAFGLLAQTPAHAGSSSDLAEPFARLRDPRQFSLIGHVAHVESDGLVDYGRLGLGLGGLRETALYLGSKEGWRKYPHLALLFHDPAIGAVAAGRLAFHFIAPMKAQGIYPINVFYGLDEFRSLILRMQDEATVATRRGWSGGTELTGFLERRAARVAGPLWSRFRERAAETARIGGGLWRLGAALGHEAGRRLSNGKPVSGSRHRRRLHLVAFGGGAAAAVPLAPALADRSVDGSGFERIDSFGLVAATEAAPAGFAQMRTKSWRLGASRLGGVLPGYGGDWNDLVVGLQGRHGSGDPREAQGGGLAGTAAALYASQDLRREIIAHMLDQP